MPRIRSIHPGLFTDDAFMELTAYAMAAWPGILCHADDNGIFEWKAKSLKAKILPCANVEFASLLTEYSSLGMVMHYEVEGKEYGAIRNFRKWQRPEKPKAWHPVVDGVFDWVGLSPTSRQPVTDEPESNRKHKGAATIQPVANQSPTDSGKSPQREEEGEKEGGESEKEHRALADEIQRDTSFHLDGWEDSFLANVAVAEKLTDAQAERFQGIVNRYRGHKGETVVLPVKVWIKDGSPQMEAWEKYRGRKFPRSQRGAESGWYFDAEWPPNMPQAVDDDLEIPPALRRKAS